MITVFVVMIYIHGFLHTSIHTVAERVCAHHAHALEVEYVCDSHCVIFIVVSALMESAGFYERPTTLGVGFRVPPVPKRCSHATPQLPSKQVHLPVL
jgi:hypothetical protein